MRNAVVISLLWLWVLLCGCGPRSNRPTEEQTWPAARWVPAEATTVMVAPTVRAAVAATRELAEVVTLAVGLELADLERELEDGFGLNPLSIEALAKAGINLDGSVAVYLDGLWPTLVFQADATLLDQALTTLRAGGRGVSSSEVAGAEVYAASVGRDLFAGVVVADGWMWLTLRDRATGGADGSWFAASRAGGFAGSPGFADALATLHAAGAKVRTQPVVGVIGTAGLLDALRARDLARGGDLTTDPCFVTLRAAARPIAVAMGADAEVALGTLAVDLGPMAALVDRAISPPPGGWAQARVGAPISVEVNVRATEVARWLGSCGDIDVAHHLGFDTIRLAVHDISPAQLRGQGVLHADLVHTRRVDQVLDMVPGRRLLERQARFGGQVGSSLRLPMLPPIDYVLTKTSVAVGVGESRLAPLFGPGQSEAPVLRLEVTPSAWPAAAWDGLLGQLGVARAGLRQRMVARLQRWRAGAVTVVRQDQRLILRAEGWRTP